MISYSRSNCAAACLKLFAEQLALAVLVAQGEIPVLREFLGELETVVLGADAAIATGETNTASGCCSVAGRRGPYHRESGV